MASGEMSYKPGTIRKLKLINFMCHESFELDFGPRANFVIGPNGSGKSALLTALVVVLGGRASTTSRAKRASDFVKYGKRFARIICELHNYDKVMQMSSAFKPDEYGKFIVIEKTIYNDELGASKLVLKNDRLQRVSERKQELDELLDHFGILINNPICILNQEVSKTFLHSKRPEDKFELFLKATNLDQIENDYMEAKQNHIEWKDVNDRKEIGYRLLDKEYQNCKEKMNFLTHRLKLEDNQKKLYRDISWAVLRDQEEKAKLKTRAIDEAEDGIKSHEADIAKRRDSIEESELKIEKYRIKVETCNQESEKSKKKVADATKKHADARLKQVDIQHAIDGGKTKLTRTEREKARTEKAIEEVQRRLNDNSSAQDTEKRKLDITQLEREIENDKASATSIRQHSTQLDTSMSATRAEQHKARMKLNEIKSNLSEKTGILNRLVAGQGNEIEKYGSHISRIHQEVEKAYKEGRFMKKPRGPLGLYIKLKSEDIASALEVHLGRNSQAFICDNIKDMAVLNLIIQKVRSSSSFPNVKDPMIMTRKFGKRHEVSRFKVQHDRYRTMLDYLDIEEDSVFNAIVDRTSLEQILFIPDYNEAQNLMITPSSIPRNTRCAYTKDCYVMYPRTAHSGYRCMANNRDRCVLFAKGSAVQIRETQREIEMLKREEVEAIAAKERIERDYEEQKSEALKNQEEIKRIQRRLHEKEIRLLDLKTTMTEAQSDELPGLEAELDKCLANIHETKLNIERETSKLAAITNELSDLVTEKKSSMEMLKLRERERHQVNDCISKEKDTIKRLQDEIDQFKLGINRLKHNIDEFKNDLANIHKEMSEAQKILPDEPRPDTIAATETIRREIEKINAQLRVEIEEGQDPEELMQTLRRRMGEITSIIKLKDQNLSNFGLTDKSLKAREEGLKVLRDITRRSVSTTFTSVMRAMGMLGQLNIYLEDKIEDGKVIAKAKTLEMSIDTSPSQRPIALNPNNNESTPSRRETRSQPELSGDDAPRSKRARLNVSPSEKENKKMTDTRSLSGGERSFSTVAFVLSLWHHCVSPFKLMDEIDVFMDMVTRRMSYNALITFAEVTDHSGQFIFFSPLELPKLDRAENLVRVFEMPRIIRRGIHSQPEGGDEPMSIE